MSSLTLARHQWAEGKRLLDAAGDDTARSRHLRFLVDAVADELARRVGQTFTLGELAQAYDRSEDWVRDVIVASMPARSRAGIKDTALVQDAAFALYAQGASDYRP
jgi:enamine deaminase RidA (YjgF/YER057c/UK114 family)